MARNTPEQAARKSSPVHRGYDGHLPGNPVDTGYVAPRSPGVEALAKKGELIDFAPSILNLLCRPVPAQMQWRILFQPDCINLEARVWMWPRFKAAGNKSISELKCNDVHER